MDGIREVATFDQRVAEKFLSRAITVKFCTTPLHLAVAFNGPSEELVFNKFRLGADGF